VDPSPGALTGDPAGLASGGGNAAVEGRGELQRYPGAPPLEAGEKTSVLIATCLFEDTDLDPKAAGAEATQTAATHLGAGIPVPHFDREIPASATASVQGGVRP
jgi:hypothetical protein